MRQERMLGVAMLVAGLAIAGVALTRMGPDGVVQAHLTQQAAPPAAVQDDKPAESMPGGTRPTTPAPEPARPQNNRNNSNEGATTGAASSNSGGRRPVTGTPRPPAPVEKAGEPLQRK